jgi:HD-GYP domain-containing protein (c-di-GMP phosphodiesterase class II)
MTDGFRFLVFGGTPEQITPEVKALATAIDCLDYDVEKMMEPIEPNPNVVLCFAPDSDVEISALEIAQTLRAVYEDHPIFFMTETKDNFDKKKLIKNGFTSAYILPWERADLIRSMREEALYTQIPALRDYKAIKAVDIIPDQELGFNLNIHLPLSNKILPLVREGETLSQEKMNKLMESNQNTLYLNKEESQKFSHYAAEILVKKFKPGQISETEKQERLDKCVRDLISDLFIQDSKGNTFGNSQALLKELQELIKLLLAKSGLSFHDRLGLLTNQEYNFYLHLTNVSTYAGLFAKVLEHPKPEDVALGGLLHDIGKINLPVSIADRDSNLLNGEELAIYRKHSDYAQDILRTKKMVISDTAMKAILQHHEMMNGKGFPKGIEGHRISLEGRILAIANRFDHLTTKIIDKKTPTIIEAFDIMIEENSKDPGRIILDVDLIIKLKEMAEKK